MYHSPGAVEEFVIVGCVPIAHIHESLYIFLKGAFVYVSQLNLHCCLCKDKIRVVK